MLCIRSPRETRQWPRDGVVVQFRGLGVLPDTSTKDRGPGPLGNETHQVRASLLRTGPEDGKEVVEDNSPPISNGIPLPFLLPPGPGVEAASGRARPPGLRSDSVCARQNRFPALPSSRPPFLLPPQLPPRPASPRQPCALHVHS